MKMDRTSMEFDNSAVLDTAHIGDVKGALGTITYGDETPRRGLSKKLKTLLAIIGPGLIVMVGDNDAGAFGTYTQAGQNYGVRLLWTLLLLIPVLYVNQEMVIRLGAVSGVGHARLIFERFGRFWGRFSVIDLFILNAFTIVTEFIGVTLAVGYLGIPKIPSVLLAAVLVVAAASTGSFRRFERICLVLVAGSLVLIPVYVMVHPPLGQMTRGMLVPGFPPGAQLSTVMLLIIAIVGTTVAPWQLFFQQSYLIDKRITTRFIQYARIDLWLGIVIVIVGAAAMFGFTYWNFKGQTAYGHFTSAQGVAQGLATYTSRLAGNLFAIALLDASIIGAAAVGLSTAYATSDVLGRNHSLHRTIPNAKVFYICYAGLMAVAAGLVLTPGVPLGLITEGVQTLAGVLLPSATVFLLLLCNDKEILGPWVNGKWLNFLSSIIVGVLVLLSVILTASILFPNITGAQIVFILAGGMVLGILMGLILVIQQYRLRRKLIFREVPFKTSDRNSWKMPALSSLQRPLMSMQRKIGMITLRGYLGVAFLMVVFKIISVATK